MRHGLRKRFRRTLMVGGLGAVAGYFFDPAMGRARRTQTVDRIGGIARGVRRKGERLGRRVEADAYGLQQKLAHPVPADTNPDDATLAHKVESEVLGDPDVPKGQINVNAENGVVVLRGIVRTPDQIRSVEARVRAIPGVRDVSNLLHLPNTPAPNKQEALGASGA